MVAMMMRMMKIVISVSAIIYLHVEHFSHVRMLSVSSVSSLTVCFCLLVPTSICICTVHVCLCVRVIAVLQVICLYSASSSFPGFVSLMDD